MNIVLNLKEVRLRVHSEEPKTLRLHKKGEGILTAGDLGSEDSAVEILNPEHKIATLSSEADIEMEVGVKMGKGYVPAEKNKTEDMPIGTIPIDAIFSPVQKINYMVTPARVGRETDFDRLNLEVWADGTVAPADAVAYGAKILKEQLTIFINFPEEDVSAEEERNEEQERLMESLLRSVDELELSVRSSNCLRAANIQTLEALVQRTEAEMLKYRNFGRKSLTELNSILNELGLQFGMDVSKYKEPEKEK